MKVRVTIDVKITDENMRELDSLERGVYRCDKNGIYYMWYGSRSDLAEFENIEIIEHDPPQKDRYCTIENCEFCKANNHCGCCKHDEE